MLFSAYLTLIVDEMKKGFDSLKRCEKGIIERLFLLKFLESYSYFALSQILVLFLHSEFGFSDATAGTLYGAWGLGIMIAGFCLAPLNDGFGVRRALQVGSLISAFSYCALTLCTSRTTIIIILCIVLPIGSSLGIPMLTIGIKKVTDKNNRGFAFALFYTIMNVAAFVTGPIVDAFNVGRDSDEKVPGTSLTGNRFVIMTCILCSLTSFVVVTYSVSEDQLIDYYNDETVDNNNNMGLNIGRNDRKEGSRRGPRGVEDEHSSVSPSVTSESEVVSDINSKSNSNNCISDGSSGTLHHPSHLLLHEDKQNEEDVKKVGAINGQLAYKVLVDSDIDNEEVNSGNRRGNVMNPLQADGTNSILDDVHLDDDNEDFGLERKMEGGKKREKENKQEEDPITQAYSYKNLYALTQNPTFWRYVALTLFLINLKSIFRHLDATLPTYLVRQHGNDIPKGLLYSLNPAIIMILTPLIGALMTEIPHYDMIKYGGYITGVSPFALVISSSLSAAICMIVILSIGEAIWSPRVYDYAMSVAPDKKEATFGALSAAPIFVAKLPVGFLSGYLLQTYMPEDEEEERQPQMMWLIIGLLTISSPIAITVFEKYIREPEVGAKKRDRVRVNNGEEAEYELIESPIHEQGHDHSHSHSRGHLREREKMRDWKEEV